MVEQLDAWIHTLGPYGPLVLAIAALLEHVFPPFPGDTVLLLGGIYVVRGEQHWALCLLAVTIGGVVGTGIDYALGRLLADRFDRHPEKTLLGLPHRRIHEAQALMRRHGGWIILANRFLPTFRAVVLFAAGAARMPLGKVLALSGLSSLGWNALILGAGMAVGGNVEQLVSWFEQYRRGGFLLLALALGVGLLVWWVRRRRGRGATGA